MLKNYQKLYSLLDTRERRRGLVVMLLLVVVAFGEVLGVASIMPFVAVLSNPEVIETNPYLAFAYHSGGFESRQSFLFFLGLAFFLLLVGSLALRMLGIWAQLRFTQNRDCAWGTQLVQGYLRQPYEWFLNKHSSDLATSVLAEVRQVVTGSLFPAMQIVAYSMIALFLLLLLLAADPLLAVAVFVLLGGGYYLISIAFRSRLRRLGTERRQANQRRFNIVQEAFGGIKDVKVAGFENSFARRFRIPAQKFADRQISSGLISQIPPIAMQGLLFGGMLLVLLYLIYAYGSFQQAVPLIALYAFAGYRLMPALQNVYQNVSQLRFSEAALDSLCADFEYLEVNKARGEGERDADKSTRLPLRHKLELRNVSYGYPNAERAAIKGLSLAITANQQVGFVGSTGSGKTTTVDLILGLLRPADGSILVDGQELTRELLRPWQRSLGYVPQQIFLSDNTVFANIAFGVPEKEIDMEAVEKAARIANLHDFVTQELPAGYDTYVGERGVRLSGGQRQRIGIARALYHDPDVLIMDEATSALDNLTEQAVMDAVHNLSNRKTIILVAHRLSTVRSCDSIFLLEHGELVASGSYSYLFDQSKSFRAMAQVV